MSADRNLLFGVLAVQMDFISRDELIAAMNAWVLDKQIPLAEHLLGRGALAADERNLLESLVRKHLQRHADDPEKSLAAVAEADTVREVLAKVADVNVRASLSGLATVEHRADSSVPDGAPNVDPRPAGGSRFRVLRAHAKGGLGEVFVARDEELHREVALKQILDRHADNAQSRARFVQEAEITGSLEHPGIVPVYGLGTDADGRPFYAMRFIRGDSLQDAITRFHQTDAAGGDRGERVLELRKLLGHLIAVCNAIEYAHSRGVLHRDIKPSNIMLGKFGETLVVDWGLAKPIGSSQATADAAEPALQPSGSSGTEPTQMGAAVGTPAYMSPEQAAGQLDELGPRSDVYGLGATLYSLLTGGRPFDGDNAKEVLQNVKQGKLRAPREVNRHISPALEAICLKAMARMPADRYASAAALADDLENWLADEPVTARPDSSLARAGRWSRRHAPLVWSTAISAFLMTVAAALIGRYYWLAKANEAEAAAVRVVAAADRQLAESDRFAALLNQTRQRNAKRPPGWVKQSLEDLAAAAGLAPAANHLAELRSEAAQCLASVDVVQQTPVGTTANYACLSFVPDGSSLAVAQKNAQVQLMCSVLFVDPANGNATRRLPMMLGWNRVGALLSKASKAERLSGDGARCMAFSPPGTGRWLVVGTRNGDLFRWDLHDDQPRSVRWRAHGQDSLTHILFSPDGASLYSVGNDQTVRRWDIAGGWSEAAVYRAPKPIRDCAMNPATGEVVCSAADETLFLSAGDLEPAKTRFESTPQVCVSPDGQTLALVESGRIQIRRIDDGELLWEMYDDSANAVYDAGAEQLEFSPDGTLLIATSGDDRRTRLWYAHNGRSAATFVHAGQGTNRFACSPDGRQLAVANDQRTAIYTLDRSEIQSFAASSSDAIAHFAASADLRRIACYGRASQTSLWDRVNGKFVQRWSQGIRRRSVNRLAMSADGGRLVAALNDRTVATCIIAADGSGKLEHDKQPELKHVALAPDGNVIWGAKPVDAERLLEGEALQPFDFVRRTPISEPCVVTRDLLTGLGNVECMAAGQDWVLAGCRDGTVAPVKAPQAKMADRWFVGKSDGVTAVALSGDESVAIAGTEGGRICVFSIPGGAVLGKAEAHAEFVGSIAANRSGELIATASPDRTIRLWKLAPDGLQELLTLRFHAPILSIHLAADGSQLAALVSNESALRIWNLDRLRARLAELSLNW
jgi:eukaryotic-like serine/threonine-protein kinase